LGRKKALVVSHQHLRRGLLRQQMLGDGAAGDAHAGKRKFVADDSAPARCAEVNRFGAHGKVLYRGALAAEQHNAEKLTAASICAMPRKRIDEVVVLVTCRSRREARRIARTLVEEKLAACVNIAGAPVESIYRWKGRVETAREILLLVKTSRRHFRALERRIRELHSYDVPEVIALPIAEGSAEYLRWIKDSLRSA
jgi:periplasmic divalent cation tolerance protein